MSARMSANASFQRFLPSPAIVASSARSREVADFVDKDHASVKSGARPAPCAAQQKKGGPKAANADQKQPRPSTFCKAARELSAIANVRAAARTGNHGHMGWRPGFQSPLRVVFRGGLLFWEDARVYEWLAFAGIAAALWTVLLLLWFLTRERRG